MLSCITVTFIFSLHIYYLQNKQYSMDNKIKDFFDDLRYYLSNNCAYREYNRNVWLKVNFKEKINDWDLFICSDTFTYDKHATYCDDLGDICYTCRKILEEKQEEFRTLLMPYINHLEITKLKTEIKMLKENK